MYSRKLSEYFSWISLQFYILFAQNFLKKYLVWIFPSVNFLFVCPWSDFELFGSLVKFHFQFDRQKAFFVFPTIPIKLNFYPHVFPIKNVSELNRIEWKSKIFPNPLLIPPIYLQQWKPVSPKINSPNYSAKKAKKDSINLISSIL